MAVNRQPSGGCTMANRKTPTTEAPKPAQAETRQPTFDLQDPALQAIIAQAVAVAIAAKEAEMQEALAAKTATGRSERSMLNEIAVVKAFKKAGFGNVKPHEDVRTFNRWMAAGYRPVEGSKSLKIKNLRLFHKSQCRPITAEEKQAMQEQSDAALARLKGTVVQLMNPQ
jgi:hypothetical protein